MDPKFWLNNVIFQHSFIYYDVFHPTLNAFKCLITILHIFTLNLRPRGDGEMGSGVLNHVLTIGKRLLWLMCDREG